MTWKTWCRWSDNIGKNLKEIVYVGVKLIHLVLDIEFLYDNEFLDSVKGEDFLG
jgi:hypothetical protein